MGFDTAADIKRICLDRADEATDGSSDFATMFDEIFVEVWRDLVVRHPWLCLIKDPPGALLTTAAITSVTITVAAAGANVAATLSAVQTSSLVGLKIAPSGANYFMRVTAHAAPSANITVDAAPEVLSASACAIYQDEYTLAADLGVFVDGLWTPEKGDPVPLWPEERLKTDLGHGAAVPGYPPLAFARLTTTKIRLSSYPTAVRRLEYPYAYEPTPPVTSSTATLVLAPSLRATLAAGCLGLLYKEKLDRRYQVTAQSYERRIQRQCEYETRQRIAVLGRRSGAVAPSTWGE